jgi:hypothetical protein
MNVVRGLLPRNMLDAAEGPVRAGRDVLKEGRNPVIRCYREGHEGYGILFGSVALPAASASVTAWSYPQPIIAWSTCVLRH